MQFNANTTQEVNTTTQPAPAPVVGNAAPHQPPLSNAEQEAAWLPKLFALRRGDSLTTAVKVDGITQIVAFKFGAYEAPTQAIENELLKAMDGPLKRHVTIPDKQAAERIVAAHRIEEAKKSRSLKGSLANDAVRERSASELAAQDLALLQANIDTEELNKAFEAEGTPLVLTTKAHAPEELGK